MKLKTSLILAISLTLLSTICWEIYWRSQGLKPNIDDNKNLNILLNQQELDELKVLLKSIPTRPKQMKLLSYEMIEFKTFYN